jgi:hypothetical protein
MPTLTDGVLYGLGILVLDFLAWRFLDGRNDQLRLALRALMFGLSTYVLFSYGMNRCARRPGRMRGCAIYSRRYWRWCGGCKARVS